jgi:hypothetical protein
VKYRETFVTPYDQYSDRIGQRFTVLAIIDKADATHDEEVLPMYRIKFVDGTEIEAWPEEVESEENEEVLP